jgi:hypothetical protein
MPLHRNASAEARQHSQTQSGHSSGSCEPCRLSRTSRTTRGKREPPSDAAIERGLRERAVSDPRAAEILLRWLQRPRLDERVHGVDLDTMSEAQLEALYAGFVRSRRCHPRSCRPSSRACSQRRRTISSIASGTRVQMREAESASRASVGSSRLTFRSPRISLSLCSCGLAERPPACQADVRTMKRGR